MPHRERYFRIMIFFRTISQFKKIRNVSDIRFYTQAKEIVTNLANKIQDFQSIVFKLCV